MKLSKTVLALSLVAFSFLEVGNAHADVNVYSSRTEALIKPLLNRFTAETGIEVNLLTGKDDALLTRLQMEGKASPADLFITSDVARLYRAKTAGITEAVESETLNKAIARQWRDADNHWFALTSRARPIIVAKDRVDPSELARYEDLADARWKGRICIRSSSNVYNQSMVSSALIANGEEATLNWLKGLVANFSRPPAGGDTDQLKAVAAGQCDLTLANTYYLARLAASNKAEDREVAAKLSVFWPNQSDRGTHFNISGIALTKSAKNTSEAIQLMEYMVSDDAQRWYAEVNNEYPIVTNVEASDQLKSFGAAKADSVSLYKLGELNDESLRLMDRAGWK